MSSGYIISAFSGPQKWAELLCHPLDLGDAKKRGQNQKWLHHPCLLGGHNWAEFLRHPCVRMGVQNTRQNQKWLQHPNLLGGPQVGGISMRPQQSHGSAEEGTKSERATSPSPSRGPTSGRDCYVTPAF